MADIEGIKVLNLSTQKRAKKLSEKYNVPLINSESAETYVSIDDQSILHSGNYKLENSFREGKFRARISQYQGESLLKKSNWLAINITKAYLRYYRRLRARCLYSCIAWTKNYCFRKEYRVMYFD